MNWRIAYNNNGISSNFLQDKLAAYCLRTTGIVTKALYLKSSQFFEHPHVGRKYKYHLHAIRSQLLIMVGKISYI